MQKKKKKKEKRKVNASMNPMGTLQPKIPSPTIIPHNWHIIIIIDYRIAFYI